MVVGSMINDWNPDFVLSFGGFEGIPEVLLWIQSKD